MTNNLEDFEQPDAGQGGELPPAATTSAKLAHAWRTRPLFKLVVLMVVVGAVIAVGMSLFSTTPEAPHSRMVTPPVMKEAPGGQASPYFLEQQKIADEERQKHALQTGGSALPTPVGQNAGMDEMTGAEKAKKDPLIELKSEIEHQNQEIQQMRQQQAQQTQQQQQVVAPKPEQFDNSLAQAMQAQLRQLMTGWEPHGIKTVIGLSPKELLAAGLGKGKEGEGGTGGTTGVNAADQQAQLAMARRKAFVPAGTVSYAQLLTEANSDVKTEILAQILSGPLAGARAVGRFEYPVACRCLVIRFTLANLKGRDYQINALALDPDTTLAALATEVDERYITRVVLPAAAAFMQGVGMALGQNTSSVVTNGTTTIVTQSQAGVRQGMFQGLGEAGRTIGQFFQTEANNTQPLVRVAAGTPMGFFFTKSVFDRDAATMANGNPNARYGSNGQFGEGDTGYGSGYGTPGYGYGQPGGYGYNGMPGGYSPYGTSSTSVGYPGASATPYPGSGPTYPTSNYGGSPYSPTSYNPGGGGVINGPSGYPGVVNP